MLLAGDTDAGDTRSVALRQRRRSTPADSIDPGVGMLLGVARRQPFDQAVRILGPRDDAAGAASRTSACADCVPTSRPGNNDGATIGAR